MLAGDPTLRQIVLQNTNKNKDKIMDIVVTDLFTGYQEPVLLPAVPVDQGKQGVPSDHAGVIVIPRTNLSSSRARPRRKTFEVQRMPETLIAEFGPVLMHQTWSCLQDGMSADEMVVKFQDSATRLVDAHFPKKTVTITEGEKPYFTEELKKLRRKRDRIYQKSGKCANYLLIQNKFQSKLKAEALKYRNRIVCEVQEGFRLQSYQVPRGWTC